MKKTFIIITLIITIISLTSVNIFADSSVGGKISRTEVIKRAQYWVDENTQYNKTRSKNSLKLDIDGQHKYGPDDLLKLSA